MNIKTLLVACCLIITCCLFAQPSLKFEHLTANDGLSHNKVHCILQDRLGYLWFGTIYGLNRYDGYSFKVFENVPGDSTSLAINDIVSLYQDREGLIWIGTSASVFSSYNPRTETFKNYSLPSLKSGIHDFKEDENGLLWLATGYGLFSFDRKHNKLSYHQTNDSTKENIQGILPDKDKDIFWLSSETGIRKFNKKTGSVKTYYIPSPAFTDISREITHNIIQDKYGDIWMSTSGNGVYRLNPKTEKLSVYAIKFNDAAEKSSIATQLMEDSAGKIWVGGEGIAIFDHASQQFSFYKTDADNPSGIPARVRALMKDRSGIYWLGTERGIAKYDPKLYSFTTVKPNPPFTLQTTNTILEDRYRKFWVGNYVGLGSMDANTGVYTNENRNLGTTETNFIYSSLLDKDGSLWFGSESCLFHLYKTTGTANYNSSKIVLPVSGKFSVLSLCIDDNGTVWAGTKRGGLFRYDPSSKKFKTYIGDNTIGDIFSSTTINALLAPSRDSLLIGTEGMGLILMHTKNEKFEKNKFHFKRTGD